MAEQGVEFADIQKRLGIKLAEIPESAKWAGAAVIGTPAMIVGSVAVGYDQWKKDETARLAANEVKKPEKHAHDFEHHGRVEHPPIKQLA